MRILVTGGHGFLGRFLVAHLRSTGHEVHVLGHSARPNSLTADLRGTVPDLPHGSYDEVYHLAGKAHVVPRTPSDAQDFHAVNYHGTQNLLAGIDRLASVPQSFVLASTVAVYGQDSGEYLTEDTPREAADPYGLSKRLAEDAVFEWGDSRGVRITIVRLPLVVGPGAPGNLRSIIDAINLGRYAGIGKGDARRSMVLAVDVATALPALSAIGGVYHLTDGYHPSLSEIANAIARTLNRPQPPRIPQLLGHMIGRVGDLLSRVIDSERIPTSPMIRKLTSTLTFDDSRARGCIGWSPTPVLMDVHNWCTVTTRTTS